MLNTPCYLLDACILFANAWCQPFAKVRLLLWLLFVSAKQIYMLSQISDQFTSITFYIVPTSNIRTGIVWPRVILCHFHILASKYVDFVLFSRAILLAILFRSYLYINMETYPHLVSSQIPHIYYFIIYLYSKTMVLCNIVNSQNIPGVINR
jgi:hypothetical protein